MEHVLAVLLIKMHDDFCVRMRAKHVTFGFKLGLALRVVEQLAIVDDSDRAIFVEDGLIAVTETDDAQSA